MAESPIQGEQVIEPGYTDRAIKDTQALLDKLKLLSDGFIHMKTEADDSLRGSRNPQTAEELKKVNELLKKSEALRKSHATVIAQETKLKQQLIKAQDKEAKGRIKLRTVTQQQTKILKQQAREELGLVDATARLEREVNDAQRALKNLLITEEGVTAATTAAQNKFDTLEGKLRKVNAAAKDGRRDVGRYKTGFDSLGFSITQVGRELPAFAFGINTGIAALSNNLPILFEEIGRAKQEIAELTKAGKAAPTLFQRMATTIFSLQTVLILGVTALTLFGRQIQDFVTTVGEADDKLKELNKTQQTLTDSLTGSIAKLTAAEIDLAEARGDISKTRADELRSEVSFAARRKEIISDQAKVLVELRETLDEDEVGQFFKKNEQLKEISIKALEAEKERLLIENADRVTSQVRGIRILAIRRNKEARDRLKLARELNEKIVAATKSGDIKLVNLRKEEQDRIEEARIRAAKEKDKRDKKAEEEAQALRDLEIANIEGEFERKRALATENFLIEREKFKDNAEIVKELNKRLQQELDAIDAEREAKRAKTEEKIRKEILANAKWVDDQKRKEAERRRRDRIADLKEQVSFAKRAILALNIELDLKNKKRQLSREADLDNRNENLRRQEQLADKGADNQLARSKARQEKQLLQNRQALEKEAKQQAAIKFAEAYLNTYNLRLQRKDQNPDTAPLDALKDVLFAKGIGKGLVQFFSEGTDYVHGPGTATSDSIPAMLSKGEAVVTNEANANNSGVVKAMNDGTFSNKYIPVYRANEMAAVSSPSDFGYSSNKEVISALADVKNEIRNKPVQNIGVDDLGRLFEKMTMGNNTNTTIYQPKVRI